MSRYLRRSVNDRTRLSCLVLVPPRVRTRTETPSDSTGLASASAFRGCHVRLALAGRWSTQAQGRHRRRSGHLRSRKEETTGRTTTPTRRQPPHVSYDLSPNHYVPFRRRAVLKKSTREALSQTTKTRAPARPGGGDIVIYCCPVICLIKNNIIPILLYNIILLLIDVVIYFPGRGGGRRGHALDITCRAV